MKIEVRLFNCAYKHVLFGDCSEKAQLDSLFVMKEEEFALQCIIRAEEEFLLLKGKENDICRRGLQPKLRIDVSAYFQGDQEIKNVGEDYFFVHLMDFVRDDEGNLISDILTEKNSIYSQYKEQGVFIGGRFPSDLDYRDCTLKIKLFYTRDYQTETQVFESSIPVSIAGVSIGEVKNSDFYMDLWQHPCNWARTYELPYYGEEHMELIDRYMENLSKLGQKVCDLIISDYPWAGQGCYLVEENENNLFEQNIVKVSKDKEGKILCDFTSMDRYIELAEKHEMAQEINLFGILGNWDARDFGNPLIDHKDPIRISYFDEREQTYGYFRTADEVKEYLSQVFGHLERKGLWEKTLILSDEPSDVEVFEESVELLRKAAGEKKIRLKCAIHDQSFFERYGEHIQSVSLNTCELINNLETIEELKENIQAKGGTLTWYSCCFPEAMNVFLKSPLIESRLIGWFTYYMDLDGFLRWAYGVWPGDVYRSASYKVQTWAAGDMFLVYPGKNLSPLSSLRLKNILYGIQDYLFLQKMETVYTKAELQQMLSSLLGKKEEMRFFPPREVKLNHSLDYESYQKLKRSLILQYTSNEAAIARYRYFKEKLQTVTSKKYEKSGLSPDLFEDNALDIEIWAENYRKMYGIKGVSKEHEKWLEDISEMKVIKIGRLQFEQMSEDRVSEFGNLPISVDTLCLNVHIREGEKLEEEDCEESYRRAWEFYRSKGYNFTKILFVCDSWLINPKLNTLLKKDSNILKFQKRYCFLSEDIQSRQMEERVFGYVSERAEEYPEETSLQKTLKKELMDNRRFGMAKGYFLYRKTFEKEI